MEKRINAFLKDLGIICLLYFVTSFILYYLADKGIFPYTIVQAVMIFVHFFLFNGYFIFCELRTGTTFGKSKYRYVVIKEDGSALTPGPIYVRNLLREIEIWMPFKYLVVAISGNDTSLFGLWLFIFMLIPLFDKRHRRLGDILAGTIVVVNPKSVLLEDAVVIVEKKQDFATQNAHISYNLPNETTSSSFEFTHEMFQMYGRKELSLIEDIFRSASKLHKNYANGIIEEMAKRISVKIGYKQPIYPNQSYAFASEFYKRQRHFLENQLIHGRSVDGRK